MRHFFGRKNQNEYLMKFKITTKKIRKIHLVQTNMVVQQGFREVLSRSVDKYVCACVCDRLTFRDFLQSAVPYWN